MRASVWDITAVLGLGALVYGVWLLSQPAAFIIAGAVVSVFSLFGSVAAETRRRSAGRARQQGG